MKKLIALVLAGISSLVLLVGCGGGSSGGGGQFAGTYTGFGTGTVTAAGTSQPFSGGFVIIIGNDGSVTYQEGGMTLGTTTLNGNQFVVNIAASQVNPNCSGTVSVSGTVANGEINGTTSSSGLACFGTPGTITGSFTATRNSKAAATNLTDAILRAMPR